MYTDWFKLACLPFRLRPDPEFLHWSGATASALEGLRSARQRQCGVVTLVGDPGTGRTTLLHVLARDGSAQHGLARLQVPHLDPEELLATLAVQFGVEPSGAGAGSVAARLVRFFAEEAGHGHRVVILVDDAHDLPEATMQVLLGFGTRPPAPFVLLAGDHGLLPKLQAVVQREAVPAPVGSFTLSRLEPEATRRYVEHRLRIAGSADRAVFDADTFPEIHRYTGGTARLINTLCDRSLALAEAHSNQRVTIRDVRDAVQELRWVEFPAARAERHDQSGASPPAATPHGALELEVQFRGELVTRRELRPGRLLVGRGEEADLRLYSRHVSRRHCQIVTTDGASTIEDLDSTNGIVVNGRRVRIHQLAPADTIEIGDHRITCHHASETPD
jgi:general secretion pathway protein A